MEVFFVVFEKFLEGLIEEYVGMFFVVFVVVWVNDDLEKCRVVVGELFKLLWKWLDEVDRVKMVEVIRSWVVKCNENEILVGVVMGVLGLFVEIGENGLEEVISVIEFVFLESVVKF